VHERTCLQMAKAAIGTDPYVTVAVFEQRAGAEVGQAVPHLVVPRVFAGGAADSLVGGDPYGAVPALQERPYKVIDQPAGRCVVDYATMAEAVDSAAIRADPEIAGAIAEDIPDGHVRHFGEFIGGGYSAADGEDTRGYGPDGSIWIGGDCAHVGVGITGQGQHAHRRLAQSHHTFLGADPDLLAGIFKDAQDGVAGQEAGARPVNKVPIGVAIQAVTDAADPQGAIARLAKRSHRSLDLRDRLKLS